MKVELKLECNESLIKILLFFPSFLNFSLEDRRLVIDTFICREEPTPPPRPEKLSAVTIATSLVCKCVCVRERVTVCLCESETEEEKERV